MSKKEILFWILDQYEQSPFIAILIMLTLLLICSFLFDLLFNTIDRLLSKREKDTINNSFKEDNK